MMDSLKKFFTLEEDSFSPDELLSESLEPSELPDVSQVMEPSSRNKVVGLPHPRKQEIVVLEPASFADAREIAETLKVKKSILLNMRKTDKELARRIVDFLSGISYAIDGHSQKVADQIYLFTPGNIEIVMANTDSFGKDETGLALEP